MLDRLVRQRLGDLFLVNAENKEVTRQLAKAVQDYTEHLRQARVDYDGLLSRLEAVNFDLNAAPGKLISLKLVRDAIAYIAGKFSHLPLIPIIPVKEELITERCRALATALKEHGVENIPLQLLMAAMDTNKAIDELVAEHLSASEKADAAATANVE